VEQKQYYCGGVGTVTRFCHGSCSENDLKLIEKKKTINEAVF
jgi:hypothetical protein